jgi:hypothetical protein
MPATPRTAHPLQHHEGRHQQRVEDASHRAAAAARAHAAPPRRAAAIPRSRAISAQSPRDLRAISARSPPPGLRYRISATGSPRDLRHRISATAAQMAVGCVAMKTRQSGRPSRRLAAMPREATGQSGQSELHTVGVHRPGRPATAELEADDSEVRRAGSYTALRPGPE